MVKYFFTCLTSLFPWHATLRCILICTDFPSGNARRVGVWFLMHMQRVKNRTHAGTDSGFRNLDDPHLPPSLLRLSVPAMIGLLVNVFYTPVDMMFVGRVVGSVGIAALDISFPAYVMLTGIALMIGVGGACAVSRELGKGSSDEVHATVGTSVVSIVVNHQLGKLGGSGAIAAYGMTGTLLMMLNMPISGIVQGFQPIAAYHHGGQRNALVLEVLQVSLLIASVFGCVSYLLILLMPRTILGLFTTDGALLDIATTAAQIVLAGLTVLGVQGLGTALFQSIGKALPALILWIARQFVILIPMIFLLSSLWGLLGVFIAFPVSDAISSLMIGACMYHWKRGETQKSGL